MRDISASLVGYAAGTLTLQTVQGTEFGLKLDGGFRPSDLVVSAGMPGTDIVVDQESVPCFAAGTRVATPDGAVPVEELEAGDTVLTLDGSAVPVQWIGYRRVDCRRHPHPEQVSPIRIAPHAFAPNQPERPLWLSPDHAVFVEAVLVPIRLLVNGLTIARCPPLDITYYHVELPRHGILLAEGLPTESYPETGGRSSFANGGGPVRLHPDFHTAGSDVALIWEAQGYAPLVTAPRSLAPLRERLLARAHELGGAARQTAG